MFYPYHSQLLSDGGCISINLEIVRNEIAYRKYALTEERRFWKDSNDSMKLHTLARGCISGDSPQRFSDICRQQSHDMA